MIQDYKLTYTAVEINEKLGTVDELDTKLESISTIMVGTEEPDPSNVVENALYIRVIE